MKRTTDQKVTNSFFEKHNLNDAVEAYFASPFIQDEIDRGFKFYYRSLDSAEENLSMEENELLKELFAKYSITREAYEQKVFELFKEKFKDTFVLAAVYVDMEPLLKELLTIYEDENLKELLLSAMDDITELMERRVEIIIELRLEADTPLEIAEKIADEIGDDLFIIGKVEIVSKDEDEEDDEECCCSGECGGHHCNCEGDCKCKKDHSQCEGGCKCGNHVEE